MGRLWSVLKPGGMLLAFFHTKDAGPDSPCYRFHILEKDNLEMQRIVSEARSAAWTDGSRSYGRRRRLSSPARLQ